MMMKTVADLQRERERERMAALHTNEPQQTGRKKERELQKTFIGNKH